MSKLPGPPGKRSFLALSTLLKTLHVFALPGSPGKRNVLPLSTLQETVYVFELDAVQKTMKTEKNVNELSGSLEKHNVEHYPHSWR